MSSWYRAVAISSIVSVVVLGAACVAQRAVNQSAKRFPRIEFGETTSALGKITLEDKLIPQNTPSQMTVYKVQPMESKKAFLLKTFNSLPLSTDPETTSRLKRLKDMPAASAQKENPLSASIGGWTVEVWDGGQFAIDRNKQPSEGSDIFTPAPSAEESRKAADAFLARISLPVEVRFSGVGPGQTIVRGAGDKPGNSVVVQQCVSYRSELGGLSYGSVSVYVGAESKVMSVMSHIRRTVPDGTAPILTPKEAFATLQAGGGHLVGRTSDTIEGRVTSVKLAYYQKALAADQQYVLPAYIFSGECTVDGGAKPITLQWTAVVEAIRPEYLEGKPARK